MFLPPHPGVKNKHVAACGVAHAYANIPRKPISHKRRCGTKPTGRKRVREQLHGESGRVETVRRRLAKGRPKSLYQLDRHRPQEPRRNVYRGK